MNLCFHGIGRPGRTLETGEDRYWIDTDTFFRILDLVAQRPEVRISFDDGNVSDVEIGLPALQERGLVASFFILAGRLGQPGSLCEEDVVALHRNRMIVGSHGMDHRPWRGMSPQARRLELVEARAQLVDIISDRVDRAACPLGQYDRALLRELRELDYHGVYVSDRRWTRPDAWLQPRFSVTSRDTSQSIEHSVLTEPSWWQQGVLQAKGVVKALR